MATPYNQENLDGRYFRDTNGNIKLKDSNLNANNGSNNYFQKGQEWTNKTFGTSFGNIEGLQDGNYMYTDPTTGKQASVALNTDQIDAIKNPTMGEGGLAANSWGDYADIGLKGLGALGHIWQARTAAQGLDLAKEKFGFEKGLAAANYANQAKGYNEELARKANVGLALGGNAISPEQRTATLANVEANKVAPTLKV